MELSHFRVNLLSLRMEGNTDPPAAPTQTTPEQHPRNHTTHQGGTGRAIERLTSYMGTHQWPELQHTNLGNPTYTPSIFQHSNLGNPTYTTCTPWRRLEDDNTYYYKLPFRVFTITV